MSKPTREQVQEALDRVHDIVDWQAYDPLSTIDTLVAAARLWLDGPKVDEAMIERAGQQLAAEINNIRPQPSYMWNQVAERVLRAALEVSDE